MVQKTPTILNAWGNPQWVKKKSEGALLFSGTRIFTKLQSFDHLLKVRQNRNDFIKTPFPPKNEQTNSILLHTMRLVFDRFLEEIEDTKKTLQN